MKSAGEINQSAIKSGREIVALRIVDAPRELVFDVWTDPEHVARWWGPTGFTNTIHKMEVKPGGEWQFIMHGPDGTDYPNSVVFAEVRPPELLVYFHGQEGQPDRFQVTVSFESLEGRTRLRMNMRFATEEKCEQAVRNYGAVEGLNQSLSRMEEYLKMTETVEQSDSEIVITRVFDSPRSLVFKAWTDPKHLTKWWAPKGCTTPFCTVDLRPGGRFHYCMRLSDGLEIWGIGLYREVVEPKRIVYLDSFADAEGNPVPPGHYGMSAGHPAESLVSVIFDELDGRTRVTLRHIIPVSAPEREAMVVGWNEMLDRLATSLE